MGANIIIRDEKDRELGWLEPHPSGNGYIGVVIGGEIISYFGAVKNDATKWFSRVFENQGHRLASPSNMYDWNVYRDRTTGIFTCMPLVPCDDDNVIAAYISAYDGWELAKRANAVRDFFGMAVNKLTMDQIWQLEERMKANHE